MNRLARISYILSEWKVLDNALKSMCSISLDDLLIDKSKNGMQVFIERIHLLKKRLESDYKSFVIPICDSEKYDTLISVCVSSAFCGVYMLLDRFLKACEWYLDNYMIMDRLSLNQKYYSMLLLPHNKLYHNRETGLEVAADAMHAVFLTCFVNYMNSLCSADESHCDNPLIQSNEENAEIDGCGNGPRMLDPEWLPDHVVLCKQDARLDGLLRYAVILSSYPIVPLDLAGTLDVTVTRNDLEHLDVLDPGVENRRYIKSSVHPRTCISCKLDALCSGETDKIEQVTRLKCECLFSRSMDTAFEELYKCRSQALLRMLIIKGAAGHHDSSRYGCDCSMHKLLFTSNMKRLKVLLDSARVQ